MAFRDLHVPSAGNGVGDAMWNEGFTDADDPNPNECICGAVDIGRPQLCQCRDDDVAAYTDAWGW